MIRGYERFIGLCRLAHGFIGLATDITLLSVPSLAMLRTCIRIVSAIRIELAWSSTRISDEFDFKQTSLQSFERIWEQYSEHHDYMSVEEVKVLLTDAVFSGVPRDSLSSMVTTLLEHRVETTPQGMMKRVQRMEMDLNRMSVKKLVETCWNSAKTRMTSAFEGIPSSLERKHVLQLVFPGAPFPVVAGNNREEDRISSRIPKLLHLNESGLDLSEFKAHQPEIESFFTQRRLLSQYTQICSVYEN